MNLNQGAILCLGYVLGLFLTSLWGGINANPSPWQWGIIIAAIAILTTGSAIILPRHFWQLRAKFWVTVGLIALLAVGYFQVRMPRPQGSPIYTLTQTESSLLKYPIQITGEIIDQPQSKEDGKSRFWLNTKTITTKYDSFTTKGKLYTTLSNDQTTLKSGDFVSLKGRLYQPRANQDPWAFDFATYLRKHNSFFGFTAWESQNIQSSGWTISQIRERIKNVHAKFLDDNRGTLLSSMVLGRKSVDLPENIYDLWVKSGLAYTIAASGFHVALLLGSIQWFTKNKPVKVQLFTSISILIFYILLTGFQPSVLRAALMGIAGLVALALDRKTKPISLLLLVATLLLIFNPLWIWDLGFQLSFLATFGLLTTLAPLQKKLDFVPPTIATAIAIPIAASLWTLPLIAYQFNVIATYCIPSSILLTPFIFVVSLGGMISGAVGLIIPDLGAAIAYLVGIPLGWMIAIVKLIVALPGSNLSIASLHWSQLALIYSTMLIIWLTKWGKKYSNTLGFSLFFLFVIFLTLKNFTTTQVTILNTQNNPIFITQSAGKTIIFKGESDTADQFPLTSFLRQAGISEVDAFISTAAASTTSSENPLGTDFAIDQKLIFSATDNQEISQPLQPFESKRFGDITVQLLQKNPFLLAIKVKQQLFYF
ncbi:MAG: ComEC family competence protein [Limnothrix sp. RL_2_0]|nr:ComEC family competence protein [Limnothrix sp. RL_2_0]